MHERTRLRLNSVDIAQTIVNGIEPIGRRISHLLPNDQVVHGGVQPSAFRMASIVGVQEAATAYQFREAFDFRALCIGRPPTSAESDVRYCGRRTQSGGT